MQTSPSITLPARADQPATSAKPQIFAMDNLLPDHKRQEVFDYLMSPGWGYGAYSDEAPGASRYWFKHFAGFVGNGEDRDIQSIENELASFPIIAEVWRLLKANPLKGHTLMRCYANGYPAGAEGGVHLDSLEQNHFTAIYYSHSAWDPNYGGETVFFNSDRSDIVASVYPRPNRLVIFRGDVPHVARGVSRRCPELRVTLMFKTAL